MMIFDKEHNMVLRKTNAGPIRVVSPPASEAWGPPRLLFRFLPSKEEQEHPARAGTSVCGKRFLYYYRYYYRKRSCEMPNILPRAEDILQNQTKYHVLI